MRLQERMVKKKLRVFWIAFIIIFLWFVAAALRANIH